MSKKYTSTTKQGVRNLDSLPSKSVGKVVEMPAADVQPFQCKHIKVKSAMSGFASECTVCHSMWDFDGNVF